MSQRTTASHRREVEQKDLNLHQNGMEKKNRLVHFCMDLMGENFSSCKWSYCTSRE